MNSVFRSTTLSSAQLIRKVKLAYSICRQHLEAMASARAQLMTAEILHGMNIILYEYFTVYLSVGTNYSTSILWLAKKLYKAPCIKISTVQPQC